MVRLVWLCLLRWRTCGEISPQYARISWRLDKRVSPAVWPGPRLYRAGPTRPGWARAPPPTGGGVASAADPLPGAAQGAAAYGGLDVAVGEVRQQDGRGDSQGEQRQTVEGHVEVGTGHHEHRPVPQVDAVGALPDPTQRPPRQQARPRPRPRVGDDRYQGGRGEGYGHKAAPVEEGLELAEMEAEPDQGPQRSDAYDVQ